MTFGDGNLVNAGCVANAASNTPADSAGDARVTSMNHQHSFKSRLSRGDILVIPIRWHQSRGYHTIGLFAMGTSALGKSLGVDVKVFKETPGPHKIKACRPGLGNVACGISANVCSSCKMSCTVAPF